MLCTPWPPALIQQYAAAPVPVVLGGGFCDVRTLLRCIRAGPRAGALLVAIPASAAATLARDLTHRHRLFLRSFTRHAAAPWL